MTAVNNRVVVAKRPDPAVSEACFRLESELRPEPGPGELLIRLLYLSVDPAMRGWIAEGPSYSPPVPLGEVMRSFAVGQVAASNHPEYGVGSLVMGLFGWQDWALSDGSDIRAKVDPEKAPVSASLHLLGLTGITAYLGLTKIGRPKAGETVVVSTAAGAVGSIVGQIAKLLGARTVGLTGSDEKVCACRESFGYDAAINYKTCDDLEVALAEACPEGIDVYYDNTGGPITDAVMALINVAARIVVVGTMAIASHPPPVGPRYSRQILVKRARMEGFLAFDHLDDWPAAADQLARWYGEGRISYREDVAEGLAAAPGHLVRLLNGENRGKALVHLGDVENGG
jgi:NADPH-dependent curcumin reductase CurA